MIDRKAFRTFLINNATKKFPPLSNTNCALASFTGPLIPAGLGWRTVREALPRWANIFGERVGYYGYKHSYITGEQALKVLDSIPE